MGDYSRNTFDKLKHYAGVRMQQGVPLIDADWNEMEDIRKEDLRLFLEWYIGNGIPRGNDGFAILLRANTPNDFIIKGGASGQPGLCLVKGMENRIETDTPYTSQVLFNNSGLAEKWGVTPLAALTLPSSGVRSDLVYLDAWEREVDSQEDANLVNPAIGMETTVRIKREWVVRVAEGASALPAAPTGHAFYTLAVLTRRAGQNVIAQADITDKRRKNVEPMDNSFSDYVSVQNDYLYIDKDVKSTGRFYDQTGYVMPPGGIIMWSGAANAIPQGWALCNGTNGTPDLRNRFIVGAGDEYNPGNTGGGKSITLTKAQMPSHNHGGSAASAGSHHHWIEGTDANGLSERQRTIWGSTTVDMGYGGGSNSDPNDVHWRGHVNTDDQGGHSHSLSLANEGSSDPHENRPPYYALCYIMKK